jgi:sterol desaturase/sphingolipid hydroxylase (fatty acid hydroxylase superfamily)
MQTVKIIVGLIFVVFIVLELARGRFLHRATSTRRDAFTDAFSSTIIAALVIPGVLALSTLLCELIMPDMAGAWSDWPAWIMFGLLLVGDDMTQYWWHRLSHTSWLYPLHRAHHSGEYLSVRVVYRNNPIYYALMPGLWIAGALIYLGFLKVYVVYAVCKMTVIIGAHSSVPWDDWLYRQRWAQPLMWVLERLISTPATHSAHHGKHADDGVTHYHGNYGNFLFLWDVLFGTARITRRRPDAFGIEGLAPIPWHAELLWPYGHTPEPDAELDARPTALIGLPDERSS